MIHRQESRTDDDHKKPGVAFWATVGLVVILVVYPLSFGPACWISTRFSDRAPFVDFVYQPLMRIWWRHKAVSTKDLLYRYGCLFASPGGDFSSEKIMKTGVATYSFRRTKF